MEEKLSRKNNVSFRQNALALLAFENELLLLNNSRDLHEKLEQWFCSKAEEVGREASLFGTSR